MPFVREAAERLEPFDAQLRRGRALCNGRPFIEKHAQERPARLHTGELLAAHVQALRGAERGCSTLIWIWPTFRDRLAPVPGEGL